MASGVSKDGAFRFANSEAKLRQRVSRVIGYDAARTAEVSWIGNDDAPRFVITGDAMSLTAEEMDAIGKLSSDAAEEAA